MNYLDLLPNDVIKIINRKVEDLRIISRRNERKTGESFTHINIITINATVIVQEIEQQKADDPQK